MLFDISRKRLIREKQPILDSVLEENMQKPKNNPFRSLLNKKKHALKLYKNIDRFSDANRGSRLSPKNA
jgi:hypothetical protein